jgi:AraC-like DNA-binding protein
VQAARVESEEAAKAPEAPHPQREEREPRQRREAAEAPPEAPATPLPTGPELLDRIRPLMRKNRREPGGSGSMSFLSRALKCSESALVDAFTSMGLNAHSAAGDPPVFVEIGDESWWLNKDSRGGIWINARAGRAQEPSGSQQPPSDQAAPAGGNVLAAVRLLLKETKTGSVAAPVERLAGDLGKSPDELIGALTASGLHVPEKSREKPVFAEHAGEIFWLNLNGKGELWLNAKASKYSDGGSGDGKRRPRPRKMDGAEGEAPSEAASEAPSVG